MDVPICDNCKQMLVGKSYVYTITEKQFPDPKDYLDAETFEEAVATYNADVYKRVKKTRVKDMCAKCKKIFDYFCSIRASKMKTLQEAMESMFKEEPKQIKIKRKSKNYCNCIMSIDEGELKTGHPNGICFGCEKKIKGVKC